MTKNYKNKKKIHSGSGKQKRCSQLTRKIWGFSGRCKTDKFRLLKATSTEQPLTQHRENMWFSE